MGSSVLSQHFQLHQSILAELHFPLEPGAKVLDFGCGKGAMVQEYRSRGIDAFGCDIDLEHEDSFLKRSDQETNRLPFNDNSFDFVFSDQVFEHVKDLPAVAKEIHRVLRPGGLSLNIFPSKWKPIEGHSFVPLGGVIQNYYWLLLWAVLGVRNSFQKTKRATEVAKLNYAYLRAKTHYLSRREIVFAVKSHFDDPIFAEEQFIKHSYGHSRHLRPLVRVVPQLRFLYGTFYGRVLVLRKTSG